MKLEWPFDVSPDGIAITTKHVTQERAPITYVVHENDEDGEPTWQFYCAGRKVQKEDYQLVKMTTIVGCDPTVVSVAGLPLGFCARRGSVSDEWQTMPIKE